MLHSIIRRGLMTMLMGLALCSLQSYAASRILFTTALPVGSTITLSISADGTVTAQGLAGPILTDGKAHAYTIESAEVKLSGAITAITLSHQKISALDIRQAKELTELRCDNNNLTELNITYAKALQRLDCTFNQLERLDIPSASPLKELRLKGNYVKSLALDRCSDLEILDYSDNYYPTVVDLSKCTKLQQLDVAKNKIRKLDLTQNGALRTLSCGDNEISILDVAHLASLERLSVANSSNLATLTLGEHPKLRFLDIYGTQVQSLDLAKYPQLEELSCAYAKLTSLDLSHSNKLRILSCGKNPFKGLDVSHSPLLEALSCGDLQIASIDLSKNPKLISLQIGHNNLSQIDLSAQKDLKRLHLFYNNISTLDLSAQTHLEELLCNNNNLSEITFAAGAPLSKVEIYDNQIKEPQMARIVAKLPNRTGLTRGLFKVVNSPSTLEGNVCTKALVEQALGNYWRVVDYADFADFGKGLDYRGSDAPEMGESVIKLTFDKAGSTVQLTVGGLGLFESTGTTKPIGNSKEPVTYTLEGNELTIHGDLYKLIVSGATIKALELTKATYLRELELHDYQPATITLVELPNLVSLRLHDNQLTSIELSGTPLLNYLSCYGNKLTVEAGKKVIASLPKRLEEERATILWLNSKGEGADNAFQEELLHLAHAQGWEMSDYLGGSSGDTGEPIGFPIANEPLFAPAVESMLQVSVEQGMLQVVTAPHTPLALYDMMGQQLLQTQANADGRCEISIASFTEGIYIVATPIEAVKVVIP
ncbi:leucine-rich repeat domain-containing protein [uncultured Porphyromonas sp.]|uniref:leucine-rich repeat domain-containing protein n=1 Tax=uncultured Porphyromonas sp. TaxID=159274 RepID=UPI0028054790|nr:leucine-rich repeat domain-containing protein [uncultured Porphyromonas sp.]